MSTIAEMRAKLLEEGTPFKAVEGGMELAAVTDSVPLASPAAFVLVAKDVSGENSRATGPVLQRSERDIMVVYVLKHVAKAQAAGGEDQLEVLKSWARGKLIGFKPSDMDEKITHVGGEIAEVRAGHAWFEDTFSAPTYLTETS